MRPGEQLNLSDFMEQAHRMQQQLQVAQAQLAETEVVGTSGGGLVTVTMTAAGDVRTVRIDSNAVDLDNIGALESMLVAAFQEATAGIRQLSEQMMAPLTDSIARINVDDG